MRKLAGVVVVLLAAAFITPALADQFAPGPYELVGGLGHEVGGSAASLRAVDGDAYEYESTGPGIYANWIARYDPNGTTNLKLHYVARTQGADAGCTIYAYPGGRAILSIRLRSAGVDTVLNLPNGTREIRHICREIGGVRIYTLVEEATIYKFP